MKTLVLLLLLAFSLYSQSLAPVQHTFMQGNNINTVFYNNCVFNRDNSSFPSGVAGFIWPVSAPQRLTAVYSSGMFIGAKVGPQRELRLAASFFESHFTPGNIPVTGQVPPSSVCSDPTWRGYLVQLTDPALVFGGTRIKTAGGRSYSIIYDSWAAWPVQKGAPYVEVNGIPGYQPEWNGDRPGIGNGMTTRPEEILFVVYMDYSGCTNNIHSSAVGLPGGTLPLGVEVQQLTFNFNCDPLRDMYFIKYRVINKSNTVWDSTYITNINDIDIGEAWDDAFGCDISRNLGFTYNFSNNDSYYGMNPPALGVRIVQSPIISTNNPLDTAFLPYDTLIGFKLTQLSGFNGFINGANECFGEPDNANNAFEYMRGRWGCGNPITNWVTNQETTFRFSGNACTRSGWYDSTAGDKRTFSNMGPVTMQSGDTQIVVLSYIITRNGGSNLQNVCALQSLSDSALKYYYNDFKTCVPIGIEPISSEIPQMYELLQNYPNPFNPMTKLKFQMPKSGFAKIAVFDVTGREIAVIVNQTLKPGTYEIEWDASNVPSGVYFYSLITNEFTKTKKMVVLK